MPKDPDLQEVKRRLRSARSALGISQREATKRAGISQSVLEKYESRDNLRLPSTKQLFRLAEVYDVGIDYLLGRTNVTKIEPVPPEPGIVPNGDESYSV